MDHSFKVFIAILFWCAYVEGNCDPEVIKDSTIQCLLNNQMGTFYQFPILPGHKYRNLCLNTTCLTYCMETVASPCWFYDHMIHLGNADALTAAYLGLCDQPENEVKDALNCAFQVSNQDALNAISPFQITLENDYTTRSTNSTAICINWLIMKATLDTLVSAQCGGTSQTHWLTFLNTVSHKCDSSLSPSWYADYRQTSVDRCSGTFILRTNVYTILCFVAWTLMFLL